MSAASDVTSGPDAQRSGAGGAAVADAMTPKLAQLNRDREVFDDVKVRVRSGCAVEGLAGREHGLVVNAESQTLSRKRCLDIVKDARALLRKAARPAARTVINYTEKSSRLFAAFDRLSGNEAGRWARVLQPYAAKKNSFYAMRAAASWRIRMQIRALLAQQCRMQRRGVAMKDWHNTLTEIEKTIARVLAVEGVKRDDVLEAFNTKPVRADSKRKDLRHFSADWREQMIEASASGAYGAAVWVLANTGCRPEELLKGVELRPEFAHITVRINGAKTSESSGQSQREMDVSWRSVPFELIESMAGRETLVVRICSTGALRNAVADVGKRLWPRGRRICPYHFRHHMAEDLRGSGWMADEIGAVLGHCVGETSANYGRRRRKGQGGVPPEPPIARGGVRTTSPVRQAVAFDPSTIRKKQRRRAGPTGV